MQDQPSWWVSGLAIPAFFTVLGAILGFFLGELKDRWQARRSKEAFLEAIAIEVGAIKTEFEQAAQSATIFFQKLQESGHAPQLIPRWGTTVFDTQLGKLRDVADDLVSQTIETYATVGRIERLVAVLNENSQEYVSAAPGNQKAEAQSRLGSALLVLREEIASAVPKIQALMQKLPNRKKL